MYMYLFYETINTSKYFTWKNNSHSLTNRGKRTNQLIMHAKKYDINVF
jgi:hypothetical protein